MKKNDPFKELMDAADALADLFPANDPMSKDVHEMRSIFEKMKKLEKEIEKKKKK